MFFECMNIFSISLSSSHIVGFWCSLSLVTKPLNYSRYVLSNNVRPQFQLLLPKYFPHVSGFTTSYSDTKFWYCLYTNVNGRFIQYKCNYTGCWAALTCSSQKWMHLSVTSPSGLHWSLELQFMVSSRNVAFHSLETRFATSDQSEHYWMHTSANFIWFYFS